MARQPQQRGHGEGSIFRRSDGRWQAQLSIPGGKRHSLYGRTRRDALRKLTEAKRLLDQGITPGDGRQRLDAYLAGWLETVRPPMLRPRTWERYEQCLRVQVLPALGEVTLARLTAQHVQALYTDLLAAGLSSTTVNHVHTPLHRALATAVRLDLVPRNVTDAVDVPPIRTAPIHPLTADQTARLLASVAGDRMEALYVLAVTTGMRQGELLALRWADLDLEPEPPLRPSLQVRQVAAEIGGQVQFDEPKTRKSRRRIALGTTAVAALRQHRTRQRAERLQLGPVWQDHDLVLANTVGNPYRRSNLKTAFARVLRRAGLPHIRFHDLRHTAATLLLLRHVNPKVVSELLGHASVAITLDIYSHVLPDMQQDAAAAMDAALGGGLGASVTTRNETVETHESAATAVKTAVTGGQS